MTDDIHHSRLALNDCFNCSLQSRRKIIGMIDGAGSPDSHTLCQLGEVNFRIIKHVTDFCLAVCAAPAPQCRTLDVHDFLVISAVVMDDRYQRDLMVRRGPEYTRRIEQVTIGLDVDGQPALVTVLPAHNRPPPAPRSPRRTPRTRP